MLKLVILGIYAYLSQLGHFSNDSEMTPAGMKEVIQRVGQNVQDGGNVVQFTVRDIPIALVFDANADRMRLVSPIAKLSDVADNDLERALEANFHSVLDCRYAISQGQVWSAFIHPLSDLSPELLESAISQVAISNVTFGKQFTSGALAFPGFAVPAEPEEEDAPEE